MQRSAMLVAVIVAAGSLPATAQGMKSVVDSKGKYPVVRVTGEPPHWRLDSLAVLQDSGGVGFKDVYAALIDPHDGTLLAESAPAIHRFDDHGHDLGIIGRRGSGPGEYLHPGALGWFGTDLAIYDFANARLVRASPQGKWLAQWRPVQPSPSLQLYSIDPGHVWLEDEGQDRHGQRSHDLVRFGPLGPQDTLWFPYVAPISASAPSLPAPHAIGCVIQGGADDFGSPFWHAIHADKPITPGLRASIRDGAYRIAIVNGRGDTVRLLEHIVPPVPISDAEWADSTQEYRDFMKAHPEARCHGSIDRPAFKPSIMTLAVDDSGRLWVERSTAGGARWEIWEGNTIVGSVPSPPRLFWRPIEIRAGRLAVIRESDDGGMEVAVYRIVVPK